MSEQLHPKPFFVHLTTSNHQYEADLSSPKESFYYSWDQSLGSSEKKKNQPDLSPPALLVGPTERDEKLFWVKLQRFLASFQRNFFVLQYQMQNN